VTASLPVEVQAVFDRFLTTELTTVDRTGQPITWPVTPYYRRGDPCIDVTTGLGYPKKANDAQANPLVSLLFSDPTGSDLRDPPTVLVQGSADVDDRDLEANRDRYVQEVAEKLPALSRLQPPDVMMRFFSWYYTRIYIHIRPERVYVWRARDAEPELFDAHMEEVRSGHSEEPERFHADPEGGGTTWHPRLQELGTRHPTAVLTIVSPDGFPFSVRVAADADDAAGLIRIDDPPEGAPLQAGLACLTAHSHEPGLASMRNFQVRGDLIQRDGAWALYPHRLVGGLEAPPSRVALVRANFGNAVRFHRTARRELQRRA
jgi:hypothetical protein